MSAFSEPLQELNEYREAALSLERGLGPVWISGCLDTQKVHLMHELGANAKRRVIVTSSESEARLVYEDCRYFDQDVWLYPPRDFLFYDADIKSNELTAERVRVLKAMLTKERCTVILTIDSCMEKLDPLEVWEEQRIHLRVGDEIEDLNDFVKKLIQLGYSRQMQAELPGQFALRGGILDIYPLTEENPYRIELWDTEIDSIRIYDPTNQRSLEEADDAILYPAVQEIPREILGGKKRAVKQVSFLDYVREEDILFLDEPARIEDMAETVEAEYYDSLKSRREHGMESAGEMPELFAYAGLRSCLERKNTVFLSGLDQKIGRFSVKRAYNITAKSITSYQSNFELLIKDLTRGRKEKVRTILLCAGRTRAERLAKDLQDTYDLRAYFSDTAARPVAPGEILVTYGSLHKGFEYPMIRFQVITESEIFGSSKKPARRRHRNDGAAIRDFHELSPGDLVVHENHGLGVYRGIEKLEVDHIIKDYFRIEYAGKDVLYLPVTQLELLQKYSSAGENRPKLNRLGGQDWSRTKSKVKAAVKDIAKDLVQLYAKRSQTDGYVYGADTVWQREFEELFPYELTEDQEKAIQAVKEDMQSTKIMDRLICGDVGYGKTEIAIRAAFKAVQEGRQVVYLVPTTILAQQHYNTFVQRMMNYPVTVELMSRFRTPAQQKAALAGLKKGTVDIVIGTHRLLSSDVEFKNLGLLIIDEEQRFGVTHKEKIKKMRETVDVLTLTATPIPRTLHMSLIGIRDMSVLEEAPIDRQPIQTYVMEYHDEMVREAIRRELARGGQVFYVSNRVNNILDVTARVQALAPDAVVQPAHGQMSERKLESIMLDFINGDIDVLVSTTIIETGLDIPNVNTIIIQDADRFGLSQLYQLRGRVGRSNRTGYAFLMYKKDKILKEDAEKRLSAIREFTELGSGIRIAMKDLEIRGAGNLLGSEQHGHMEAVGYDLYCRLLNDAIREEKGISQKVDFETTIDLQVDAYIPPSYIRNEAQKLDIYKRIASVMTTEEQEDMQDELIDRFGEPPKAVLNLLTIARIKAMAHQVFITEISGNAREIRFRLLPDADLDTNQVPEMIKKHRGAMKFVNGAQPGFVYTERGGKDLENQALLSKIDELLRKDFLPMLAQTGDKVV